MYFEGLQLQHHERSHTGDVEMEEHNAFNMAFSDHSFINYWFDCKSL